MSRSSRFLAQAICVVLAGAVACPPVVADEATPHIPLVPGLVVTTASHFDGKDFEVFRTITAVDAEDVSFSLRRTMPRDASDSELETLEFKWKIRRVDLETANRMFGYIHTEDPERFPGSTGTQASSSLLAQIKSGAQTPFIFGMASGPFGSFGARKYYRGNLVRVENEPVTVSVLLNGGRVALPAIHVRGTLKVGDDSGDGEFWFLDQPDNAISLRWTFKETVVQVVRIDTAQSPATASVDPIATALASPACRAELHGIYFDIASAELLAGSEPTLTAVASSLKTNPEWTVVIEGHTDNTGGDADNQSLSERRAEAVRLALVDRFAVPKERLSAAGFGETRPLESNDTVEGRARNRRVELSRTCS
jgi:outer membrane protein OmpA-like peptidoglycan-associated protein